MTEKSEKSGSNATEQLLKRKGSVLVIVDVQERLMPVISKSYEIAANMVKLIRFAKIIGMPVVITEQEKLGATIKEIKLELPDLVPFTKIEFSAYKCRKFIEKLKELSARNIILAGIETHICITQTALELLSDFNVYVVSDATSSRSLENRDMAFQRLRYSGVVITTTEMVIYELLEKAGTDEFKETLGLVK
jgi:nicotinamidase-related amidase